MLREAHASCVKVRPRPTPFCLRVGPTKKNKLNLAKYKAFKLLPSLQLTIRNACVLSHSRERRLNERSKSPLTSSYLKWWQVLFNISHKIECFYQTFPRRNVLFILNLKTPWCNIGKDLISAKVHLRTWIQHLVYNVYSLYKSFYKWNGILYYLINFVLLTI